MLLIRATGHVELACELPSLHDPPPVPLKHLTRCLRNRVQARSRFSAQVRCCVATPAFPMAASRKRFAGLQVSLAKLRIFSVRTDDAPWKTVYCMTILGWQMREWLCVPKI